MRMVRTHFRRPSTKRFDLNALRSWSNETDDEPPIELRPTPESGSPYPVDALGSLAPVARKISEQTGAPLTLCATTTLMAANLVVHRSFDVELPFRGRQVRPTSLYALQIGRSGIGKTRVESVAFKAVDDFEKETGGIAKTDTYTVHGLEDVFEKQIALSIVVDEGAKFVNDQRLNPAWIANAWEGRPLTRLQRNKQLLPLHGRRLSVCVMVQPDIAYGFLSNRHHVDQGILSRFLVAESQPTEGRLVSEDPKGAEDFTLWAFNCRLGSFLREKRDGQTVIRFSPEADAAWAHFFEECRVRRLSGDLSTLDELVNKMPENACRIAGTLAAWNGEVEVSKTVAEQAVEIARFHLQEAIRINNHGRTDPETEAAIRTVAWLECRFMKAERFPFVDLYLSSGPLRKYDQAFRKKVIAKLVEHKWIERDDSGGKVQSKFGDRAWRRDNIYRLRFGRTNELEYEDAPTASDDVKAVKPDEPDDPWLDEILAGE
jgi:hypothetical protein